ncbi:MAG: CDP-glycerol glycerophosphotransferase family protein [Lachnospiraceae bacterium]|nr:CDP-glycerol glycerophosphotransferase family protein [Lachnospiraceae bacterium]
MGNWVKKIVTWFFRLIPMREDIILESHPDFSDNALAVYQYMLSVGVNKRHRIYWALHSREQAVHELPEQVEIFYLEPRGIREHVKRLLALYRCRYILDGNTYLHKRRKGQVRIHLGHGMLIKITRDYHTKEKIGECDGYLITSPFWYDIFTEKVGIKKEVLLPLGYPRNDVLVKKEAERNHLGDYILWMPTYRQHRLHPEYGMENQYPYGMPEIMNREQLMELEKRLKEKNLVLYFRPHPVQELSLFSREKLEYIRLADDAFLEREGITLYEMLAAANALITDYSSVYYDFLLTGKQIGLTIEDREEYFRYYDCPFTDLKENIKGQFMESSEEVMAFIDQVAEGKNSNKETLMEMRNRYHSVQNGTSAEKLYRYLKETYQFDKGKA